MTLARIFRTAFGRLSGAPSVPEGERVYAIGDIHGRLDLLDQMLNAISEDRARLPDLQTNIIFLGDLVDRGPDSSGVIERLIDLDRDPRLFTSFILGNHDEVFLKAATGDKKALRFLIRIGGKETIISYGISREEYASADLEQLSSMVREAVPAAHVAFLKSFQDYLVKGDYVFVHAGIKPGVDIGSQSPTDLRWIRKEFLETRASHEKIVVHGHSISSRPAVRSNRIGIDTGAFSSGRLTAVVLEGADRRFLEATGAPDPRWEGLTD